jgi:hypothetical protein
MHLNMLVSEGAPGDRPPSFCGCRCWPFCRPPCWRWSCPSSRPPPACSATRPPTATSPRPSPGPRCTCRPTGAPQSSQQVSGAQHAAPLSQAPKALGGKLACMRLTRYTAAQRAQGVRSSTSRSSIWQSRASINSSVAGGQSWFVWCAVHEKVRRSNSHGLILGDGVEPPQEEDDEQWPPEFETARDYGNYRSKLVSHGPTQRVASPSLAALRRALPLSRPSVTVAKQYRNGEMHLVTPAGMRQWVGMMSKALLTTLQVLHLWASNALPSQEGLEACHRRNGS